MLLGVQALALVRVQPEREGLGLEPSAHLVFFPDVTCTRVLDSASGQALVWIWVLICVEVVVQV